MRGVVFSLVIIRLAPSWGSVRVLLLVLLLFLCLSTRENFFYVRIIGVSDIRSYGLSLLTLFILSLCLIGRRYIKHENKSSVFFSSLLPLLGVFLLIAFYTEHILGFYILFECRVIPVLFLILGWGYQPERVRAGIYILFYTIFASFPLLLIILLCEDKGLYCFNLNVFFSGVFFQGVFLILIIGAFLVKFPMYATHLWLPKAHVEAPVAGSMLLAGVILKLGGYGIIRFIPVLNVHRNLALLVIIFSLFGGALTSLICLAQKDIKRLVAYSSVVHIRSCIGCLFTLTERGKQGCLLIILAHGLCSSGLFYLVGEIYNFTGSRSLLVNKGLLNLMPSLSLWWFLLLARNAARPPTLNLLSEIIIIRRLLTVHASLLLPLRLMVVGSCAYGIYLYVVRQHGKLTGFKQSMTAGQVLSYLTLFSHWAPINFLIIYVYFLICI